MKDAVLEMRAQRNSIGDRSEFLYHADMDKPDYKKVLLEVDRVLKENFVASPPVRIEEIAKNYGLRIVESDFKDLPGVAGFIDIQAQTMFVNKNDGDTRKAFTIAHELGHWILHKHALEQESEKNEAKYAILFRMPIGNNEVDPVEKEANCFAANILVPKMLLDKYKETDIPTIARIFGVSPEVIGYRMKLEYGVDGT
jgi:Zn-dependent peptidase ImmA (M78 family)